MQHPATKMFENCPISRDPAKGFVVVRRFRVLGFGVGVYVGSGFEDCAFQFRARVSTKKAGSRNILNPKPKKLVLKRCQSIT